MGMRKPRTLGKATGSHKLKKAQLSSDSSDEDDDMGDMQVCHKIRADWGLPSLDLFLYIAL